MSLLSTALLALAPALAGDPVVAGETGLTFTFPELENFQGELRDMGQVQGRWTGTLEDDGIQITFWMLPREQFRFVEPEQVADLIRDNQVGRENPPRFGDFRYVPGSFGYVSYATLVRAEIYERTDVAAEKWLLTGILKDHGYALEIDLMDRAVESQVEVIEAFCREGIGYDGEQRDAEWTEDEIDERMVKDLPGGLELKDLSKPLRTEHYIVFGNSSGAKACARQIEKYYDRIKSIFPFEDVEGQRLMPVFLFRTRDQYIDFVSKQTGWPREQASRTGGVASGDWYATTYQDPKDSTHIHELTHQIFGNRLLLRGGGSWLQEGVAVYVETKEYKGEANKVKNVGRRVGKDGVEKAAEKGEFTRFRQFFTLPSLLMSNEGQTQKGGSAAGQAYDQAGAVIRFIMEDKRIKERGQEFIRAVGSVNRGDLPSISRVIRQFYDVSIEEFEEMYAEYWKKAR